MGHPDQFAAHYDDYYTGDPDFNRWRCAGAREKFKNIATLWQRSGGGWPIPAVADIGCGNGAIAQCMSEANFYTRLAGFDVSSSGISEATGRGLPNAAFQVSQGAIPAASDSFDLAVLSHVVEHVEEPRKILREAARIARWVVVEVPLEHNLRHLGDFQWTDLGHVNFYNLTLIRQLVQSVDLEIVDELVTVPSFEWMAMNRDLGGLAKWWLKRIALGIAPPAARGIFTYHATLLARATAR